VDPDIFQTSSKTIVCVLCVFQVHFQHDSLFKDFSQLVSFACCQLSTDWEHTFHIMPQIQELTAGPGQVEPTVLSVFIGIRDPELKSTVFWVLSSSCSQQKKQRYSVHSVWHSDRCICMNYERVIHRKFTPDIFQLMAFSILLTDSVFFSFNYSFSYVYFSVTVIVTHTHNRFMALWILSGTTWVSRYQKKHSPTHTLWPFDNPHVTCTVSINVFFICC